MAIYDRKNKSESDTSRDATATKTDDPTKQQPTTATDSPVQTDEKAGPDVAMLNANGPGTDKAHEEAAAKDASTDKPSGTGYVVAEGKSITTKRGMLSEGEAVSEKDFGDKDRLEELVTAGVLKKS
jgi:hypothetical protein